MDWMQVFDDFATTARQSVLDVAVRHAYVFLLIVIRLSGLMSTGPLFGQSVVPVAWRILLVISLAFFLTPMIQQTSALNTARYDLNMDGVLTPEEAPPHLHGRLNHLAESLGTRGARGISVEQLRSRFVEPETDAELIKDIFAEYSLGFLLGLGVTVLMSGLQLAGQIIDQQLSLEFGSIVNPDLHGSASVSSQMFFLLGGATLLVMEPLNGHLMMLSVLIETFDALPVGQAVLFSGTPGLFTELVQKSLLLGVQVAAPVIATMSLVSLAMGYLGHSVPQINQMVVGFPIRSMMGLVILMATFSGATRAIVDVVPEAIYTLQMALTSYQ